MSGKRKPLYTPAYVHAMFDRMRSDLRDMHSKHVSELDHLRRELDEARAAFAELLGVVRARQRNEAELKELYRQREAWEAARDFSTRLH
jgi:hypothetical protein